MSLTGDRLNEDIDRMFEEGVLDQFIEETDVDDRVAKRLFNYQIVHLSKMLGVVNRNDVVLDGSDTGTGKTYCAVALCKQTKRRPFVVCPKSVMATWLKVCKLFKVEPYAVVNYETLRNCKWYDMRKIDELKTVNCPILDKKDGVYVWKSLPRDVAVFFDEAHRCKNSKTANGQLLLSSVTTGMRRNKKILLSATIADTVRNFSSFGYLLGLYSNLKRSKAWIDDVVRRSRNTGTDCIYREIFPEKGSRMLIQEIDDFPDSQISAVTYTTEKSRQVQDLGRQLKKYNSDPSERALKKVGELLQKIERIKLPIIRDIVTDMLNSGLHVVVFLNYIDSIWEFKKLMKRGEIMMGDTPIKEREKIVNSFQKDQIPLLIVSKRLQEGLSFHDTCGKHPRASVISPSYSSQDLVQTVGRVARAGSKSKSVQRIVFIANSFEESMADAISKKLRFNKNINGADFQIKI